jgi:hypothetical protein
MGMSPQDANAILGQHGLRGNESGHAPSRDYSPGTVSRQDPPPNALIPENRVVSYWLAQGAAPQVSPSPWDFNNFLQGRPGMAIILGALVAIGVVAFVVHWLKRPRVEIVPVKDKDYYGEQRFAPSPLVVTVASRTARRINGHPESDAE